VNLKTAGGSIKVAELTGQTQVHTSGGNLLLEKLEGPVSGHTSGGNINAAGCHGPVDLKTSGGNLTLSDIEGDVTALDAQVLELLRANVVAPGLGVDDCLQSLEQRRFLDGHSGAKSRE